MEEKMALMKFLLFLTVTVHLSSACSNVTGVRQLKFNYTENTAEALLDGEQFVYYNKSEENVIPKTEWMKKIKNDNRVHWYHLTNKLKEGLQSARNFMDKAVSGSNRNEGDHTVQLMYGCKLDNGTESGYWKFSYDGENFYSLDLKAEAWTAVDDKSEPIKQKMEKEGNALKGFLQNQCILWINEYINGTSNNQANGKDPPSRHRRSAEENACPSPGLQQQGGREADVNTVSGRGSAGLIAAGVAVLILIALIALAGIWKKLDYKGVSGNPSEPSESSSSTFP